MKLEKPFKILAISGSLRRASSNTAILKAAQQLAPTHLEIVLFEGLGGLAHFNPDLELEPPSTVLEFQQLLQSSSALIISSPEYAHGVPGSLKNALDWVVGSGELVGKPTALFGVTARGAFAQASLRETLTVMMANLIEDACIDIPLPSRNSTANEITHHAECSSIIKTSLEALAASLEQISS
jgi:chromate reductase, NAD(P)H dehydrogenase (quinone)